MTRRPLSPLNIKGRKAFKRSRIAKFNEGLGTLIFTAALMVIAPFAIAITHIRKYISSKE